MRAPIDEYIIDQVYFRRTELGKTQQDISIALDHKSNSYVASIETTSPGSTKCYNCKQLNIVAKFLQCSPKDFWPENAISKYFPKRHAQIKTKMVNV